MTNMNSRQLETAWFGKTAKKTPVQDFADRVVRKLDELGPPDNRVEMDQTGGYNVRGRNARPVAQVDLFWTVGNYHDTWIEVRTDRRGQVGGYVKGVFYKNPNKAAVALDKWADERWGEAPHRRAAWFKDAAPKIEDIPKGKWFNLTMTVRNLTDRNDHNGAVKALAEQFGQGWKESNVIEAIETISNYTNNTPGDLIKLRNKVLKSLLAKAKSKMTKEEHQALYMSF